MGRLNSPEYPAILKCKKWFLSVFCKQLLKMVKFWIPFRYSKDKLPKSSNGRRWGRWRYIVDPFVKFTFLSKLIFLSKLTYMSKLINLSNLILPSKLIFLSNYHLSNCWHLYQLLLIFLSTFDGFVNYWYFHQPFD